MITGKPFSCGTKCPHCESSERHHLMAAATTTSAAIYECGDSDCGARFMVGEPDRSGPSLAHRRRIQRLTKGKRR